MDRYTVVFLDMPTRQNVFYCLYMSDDQTPRGVCMIDEIEYHTEFDTSILGKEISWEELPEKCQNKAIEFSKE